MVNHKDIVEKLSQFNNMSFTKKQWDTILKGCGCPKSSHFWAALNQHVMTKSSRSFTLLGFTSESFNEVWKSYSQANVYSVNKCMRKKEAMKRADERRKQFRGHTFFMVGGVLTTELPERD